MNISEKAKLGMVAAMLAAAGFFFYQFAKQNGGPSEKAFFYDLSEKKLFAADRNAVPPTRGINDAEEDAVRAVVIATNGNPDDKTAQKIAYLEKYAPALKEKILKARQGATTLEMSRNEALNYRLVKRVTDAEWHPMNTPAGEKIVSEWAVPGPSGVTPVVCSP